jgi:hypothetical protein
MSWDAYVRLAFEEIRLAGAGSPQVVRRLRAALLDLRTVAPPVRITVLDEELAALDTAVANALGDGRDAAWAVESDGQGVGVAAGEPRSAGGAG